MSWFNRRPKKREPEKLTSKNFSPIAEKLLKEHGSVRKAVESYKG